MTAWSTVDLHIEWINWVWIDLKSILEGSRTFVTRYILNHRFLRKCLLYINQRNNTLPSQVIVNLIVFNFVQLFGFSIKWSLWLHSNTYSNKLWCNAVLHNKSLLLPGAMAPFSQISDWNVLLVMNLVWHNAFIITIINAPLFKRLFIDNFCFVYSSTDDVVTIVLHQNNFHSHTVWFKINLFKSHIVQICTTK